MSGRMDRDITNLELFMQKKVTVLKDSVPCSSLIWRERFGVEILDAIDKRQDELNEQRRRGRFLRGAV